MRKAIKKAISLLLVAVMVFGTAPLAGFVGLELPEFNLFSSKAKAEESTTYSGTCGDNLTWTLDTATGELIISGTGDMADWTNFDTPWDSHCSSIKSVTISDGVTSIGDYAFSYGLQYYGTIESVTIPNSVTSIGDLAFFNCGSLTSITIPDGVTSIGESAFYYCLNLTNIEIPDSVTSIGIGAFAECKSLTSIEIPDSVISIDASAFARCRGLTNIEIPDSVTSIGAYAFNDCISLKSITIPDGVTSIGNGAFDDCITLESVTIPDSVTSIGENVFGGCGSLKSVTIPDGVTSIGSYAFYYCDDLTSITIPDSVTSIGDYAFGKCNRLTDVYYAGSKTEWDAISIGSYNELLLNATIHYNHSGSTEDSDCDSSVVDTYLMPTPTETTISYGDSIVLHVDPSKIPEGGYVEWYPSNGNFSCSVSSDGTTCTITPEKSGDTTFTATIYDADGNAVLKDEQTMTSKAGFFDKIIAFFKKLFGLTKTIPEVYIGI